jgi:hypothetical protein
MKQIQIYPLSLLSAGLLCAGLLFGTQAFSAEANPCATDLAKFCPDAKPGSETIGCLEMNESQLTEACRAYEIKMHGKRGEMKEEVQEQKMFRKACGNDMVVLCKDADPMPGGMMRCLNNHEKELSTPCADHMKEMKVSKE